MCRLADAECTFWDDTLDREISGSYLYSLQQKAQGLEAEIQQATDQDHATAAYEVNSVSPLEQDYHLTLADTEGLPSCSPAIYLGPGNAASSVKLLLTDMTTWHIANGSSLPKRSIPNDYSTLSSFQQLERIPSFPVTNNTRKAELHSLLRPSTQRAVIEHYLKVVAPEYTLLPVERELGLLVHENPLKWTSSHRNDPAAISLNIVFAIATGLVARDLGFRLANVFTRSKEIVQQTVLHHDTDTDTLTAARCKATAHFRRTSLFLGSRLTLYLRSVPPSDVLADELYIARCLHNISRVLATVSAPTETYLEGLIPALLQLNQKHMIISFWMAAERAPEAGPIDSIRGATASHLTARTGPDFGYPAVRMSAAEEPVSTGSGWLDNQKALDNSLPALQENYSFDYGDPLMWNFDSLDSEEIFAALLAEGEPDTVMYQ
ncbi:hypothetical protein HRR81_000293 [Exophiala dermatitidis]|nr:hypothetical protein HRR79_000296 [Exophiala dermatitidis]KAJ4584487.1 hypothetical protein HRR81_000293 [Exophiala dermatitidis]KAJ9004590.1 hypothetical protein HRR94_000295 [Exophiala dermatitidis]